MDHDDAERRRSLLLPRAAARECFGSLLGNLLYTASAEFRKSMEAQSRRSRQRACGVSSAPARNSSRGAVLSALRSGFE
jgi:hypothetical protein